MILLISGNFRKIPKHFLEQMLLAKGPFCTLFWTRQTFSGVFVDLDFYEGECGRNRGFWTKREQFDASKIVYKKFGGG